MTFRVGMKVVCVDDSPSWKGAETNLREGKIYTITGFGCVDVDGELGIEVAEVALHRDEHHYPHFRASRFRPAVEPKQEVSFTTGAPMDSERWDNRRRVVEPMPVDGWRVSVKT